MARLLTFRRQIFLNDPYPHDNRHHDKSDDCPDICGFPIEHTLVASDLTKLINKLQLLITPPLNEGVYKQKYLYFAHFFELYAFFFG